MDDDARLRTMLGARHPVAAAAVITSDGITATALGAETSTAFEIGSISKGVTGLLYVDALARGEITVATTLGELLPLGDAPAATVRLADLSTHRSGLPRLPRSAHPWRRSIALWRRGINPYGDTLSDLIEQAHGVAVGRQRPRYSNFGFELLGHALASATSTPYAELVRARVAEPLGVDFPVPLSAAELPADALVGRSRRGAPRAPWTGEALGPAGGIRASVDDMATLAQALLEGSAPGAAALDPVADFGRRVRIGAAWITLDLRGRLIVWHNGGTGGFRSWMGLDRAAGRAAVVLTATSASVDRHGFRLLMGSPSR